MQSDRNVLKAIVDNVEQVIYGKRDVIELALCAFLANGHALIEDVPGVGKTSLVSALARSFSCSFRRVQFTPDLMPSDITGFSLFNPKTGAFTFKEGAVMTQILLADEINRTSPKTQSSLLEVMEEKQVTIDGHTYPLPKPFIVLATQNPFEYVGTYPLPEAQMDRFLLRITIGYPSAETERRMLSMHDENDPLNTLQPVANSEELIRLQADVRAVHAEDKVKDYIAAITRATRDSEYTRLGASPRASMHLYRASQAWALYEGRDYVTPDDALRLAEPVLAHRLALKQDAKARGITAVTVVRDAAACVKPPR